MSHQQEQPDSRRTARRLAEAARDRLATHSRASVVRDFPETTASFSQTELPSRRSLRTQQTGGPESAQRSSFDRSRPTSQEQQIASRKALRERGARQADSSWAESPLGAGEVSRNAERLTEQLASSARDKLNFSSSERQWQRPVEETTVSSQQVSSRRDLRSTEITDQDFDTHFGNTLTRRQLREQDAALLAGRAAQSEPAQHSVMEWPEPLSGIRKADPDAQYREMRGSVAPVPLTRAALRAQQQANVQAESTSRLDDYQSQVLEQNIPRRPLMPQPAVLADEGVQQLARVSAVPDSQLRATPVVESLPVADERRVQEEPKTAGVRAGETLQAQQNPTPVLAEPEEQLAALENTARRRWMDEQDSMIRDTPPGGIGLGELSLTGSLYPAALIMPQASLGTELAEADNPYMVTGSINLSKKLSETGTIQPLDSYEADNGDDEFSDYSSSAPVGDPMLASNSISAQALDKSVGFAPIKKKNTFAMVMISLGATATLALVTTLVAFLPGLLQ